MSAPARIDRDDDGWYYTVGETESERVATYGDARAQAIADGHQIANAGWKRRMLLWNFTEHALDGFPGWERDPATDDKDVARAQLSHVRRLLRDVESRDLAERWDDIAEDDFYQRDQIDTAPWWVQPGNAYRSDWWFATVAERDRFLAWSTAEVERALAHTKKKAEQP